MRSELFFIIFYSQMRSMHEQELKALRDCMELLRRLMNERGMNLLATHIGQDVMEFLHEKDQSLSAGEFCYTVPLGHEIVRKICNS